LTTDTTRPKQTPLRDIIAYATGDGASSLVMNSIFGFSLLYFTKALGLDPKLAGIAMAVATFWDAITDPLMGHITDNTRSRFGRRHPYMLIGGVVSVFCCYAIWTVPSYFLTTGMVLPLDWLPGWLSAVIPSIIQTAPLLFWYLVIVNLLLRTALTVFLVSHGALGFEVCTDYNQRSTLQGVRGGLNMAVNLASTIAIWTVFLRDRDGIDGTTIAGNYENMGLAFCVAILVFVLFVVYATRKYAVDTRDRAEIGGNHLGQVLRNLKEVLFDPYPRTIFMFVGIVFIGIVIVTSCQMFIYVDFMKFGPWEKTIVHGSTMIGAAAGALLVSKMVRRFDKKPVVYIGMTAGVIGNLILVAIFYTGLIEPGLTWGAIPVAMLVFLAFHPIYHTGATMATTVGMSMMADVSEICRYRTGVLKDGAYSAMISFVQKAGISFGLLVNGYCLGWIGYEEGAEKQTPEVARNLLLIGFVGGTIVGLAAMFCIAWYPVTRAYMDEIKAALADKGESTQ